MKQTLLAFFLVATIGFVSSCKKDKNKDDNKGAPRTDVPVSIRGTWQYCTAGSTAVFNDNGTYVGPAGAEATSITMNADGTGDIFTYYENASFGTVISAIGYGTFEVDATNKTIKFYRTRGTVEMNGSKRSYTANELYPKASPNIYYYEENTETDGTRYLSLKTQFDDGTISSAYKHYKL